MIDYVLQLCFMMPSFDALVARSVQRIVEDQAPLDRFRRDLGEEGGHRP